MHRLSLMNKCFFLLERIPSLACFSSRDYASCCFQPQSGVLAWAGYHFRSFHTFAFPLMFDMGAKGTRELPISFRSSRLHGWCSGRHQGGLGSASRSRDTSSSYMHQRRPVMPLTISPKSAHTTNSINSRLFLCLSLGLSLSRRLRFRHFHRSHHCLHRQASSQTPLPLRYHSSGPQGTPPNSLS